MLLIMRRASLAQGLMAKVRDAPGIQLCYEPDYANADVAIRSPLASGALLAVSEDQANQLADQFRLHPETLYENILQTLLGEPPL